jgi:hypothetical protein
METVRDEVEVSGAPGDRAGHGLRRGEPEH